MPTTFTSTRRSRGWSNSTRKTRCQVPSEMRPSIIGMVSLLLDQALKETAKGKARALFDLWTDTLNMKEYGPLLERSFKTDIKPMDVERYKKYSESLRLLIRASSSVKHES